MGAVKAASSLQFRTNLEFQRALSALAKISMTLHRSTGKNTSRIWFRCSGLHDVISSGVKRSRNAHDLAVSAPRLPRSAVQTSPGRCSAANARQEQLPRVEKTPG